MKKGMKSGMVAKASGMNVTSQGTPSQAKKTMMKKTMTKK